MRLIHRALDYIIQVHNGDFHVYFREYPLFTKGSFSFSHASFCGVNEENIFSEKVGRISPWHYRTASLRTLFCVWREITAPVRRSYVPPLQTANQECKHALLRKVTKRWGHRYKAAASAPAYERNSFFQLLLFLVVSRLSSNTLRERPGSRGAGTAEFNSEPWESGRDKRLQKRLWGRKQFTTYEAKVRDYSEEKRLWTVTNWCGLCTVC